MSRPAIDVIGSILRCDLAFRAKPPLQQASRHL
jgi:hypothetical protein